MSFSIQLTANFSSKTMEVKKLYEDISRELKEKLPNKNFIDPKLDLKNEG